MRRKSLKKVTIIVFLVLLVLVFLWAWLRTVSTPDSHKNHTRSGTNQKPAGMVRIS